MPTNSSVIRGIHTGRSSSGIGDEIRGPEDIMIRKETKREMAQKEDVVNLPLCDLHVLTRRDGM